LILASNLTHQHTIPPTNENLLVIPEDGVFLLGDGNLRASKHGNQDLVALPDAHGQAVPGLVEAAGADGQDAGLVEFLDGGFGEEEPAGSFGVGFDALDEDAVEEGGEGADGFDGEGLGGG
jgi:hypothetical protein